MLAWLQRHKLAVFGTILFHILLLLVFNFWTIKNNSKVHDGVTVLSLEDVKDQLPPEHLDPELMKRKMRTDDRLSNKARNEAQDERKAADKSNIGSSDSKMNQQQMSDIDKQIEEDLKQLEQDVIQEQREAGYGYTQSEAEALLQSSEGEKVEKLEDKPATSGSATKYDGETNITYRLENRYDRYIDVTVYLCQFGGVVTVDIAVDQNGDVVATDINKRLSASKDPCLLEAALKGAENTKFNADASAPTLQRGTITFRFISQDERERRAASRERF